MQLLTNPLFIEDRSGNNGEAKRGSTLKRRIVVKNLGDRRAEIDIWIVATDQKSEPLLRWCSFSERNPFRLDARESREVILTFEIPPQATPDVYSYEVLVDAQAQYPDKPPVRRPQQLRVLPSAQDGDWGSDPMFTVQPVTQATQPYSLIPGQSLAMTIQVKNSSKRVDRFYLTCPELQPDWFTVHYPESSLDTPGRVQETDGLELNPGSSGDIVLSLHPPLFTPAGNYFPTLRLTSSNDESLVLLDVVYLQIAVSDRLDLQLHPVMQRIPAESGEFELTLMNQGNITRSLSIEVTDPNQVFCYTITPDGVSLNPGEVESLSIKATVRKGWQRPWWGRGREVQFDFWLHDLQRLRPADTPLHLPSEQPIQGKILWQPRPLWMLLLSILAALGTVGAIAFLLWYILFRPSPPPPQPEIVAVHNTIDTATDRPQTYEADSGEMVRLDWTISRLRDIQRVTIVHLNEGIEIDRKSYDFAGSIPEELQQPGQNSCESVTLDAIDGLTCQGMPAIMAQAGTHTFRLEVFSDQRSPVDVVTTDSIAIAPTPIPAIVQFSPTAPVYQLPAATATEGIAPPIQLNWEISAPDQIQELQVIGVAADGSISSPLQRYSFANGLPAELQNLCQLDTQLICRNVPTSTSQTGSHSFQLTLLSQVGGEVMKQTPRVRIQQPPPEIQSFQVDGQDVEDTATFRFELPETGEPIAIALSWQVEAGEGTRVEFLPAPGSVPAQGSFTYTRSTPGQDVLTLRITDPSGEQVTRSIVIETVAPQPPIQPDSLPTKPPIPAPPTAPNPPVDKPPAVIIKPD